MNFTDLQTEVSRGAVRNQAGSATETAVKNVINRSIGRISREALWRVLRKRSKVRTVPTYATGTGAGLYHQDSTTISVTGATFITDNIAIDRRIKMSGSGGYYTVKQINSETGITLDRVYDGATTATGTYSILGQEQYNSPIQSSWRGFMWHEEYGSPFLLKFLPDRDFFVTGAHKTTEAIPTHYRMWGSDMVDEQLLEPTTLGVVSSNAADTSIDVTVFGEVEGYPDSEVINTAGTTLVASTKTFTTIDRVSKSASTTGRIIVTGNSGNVTVATIPVGDATDNIQYSKFQLYPLPNTAFDIQIQYYKDPYKLVNANDVHDLGVSFDQAIIFLSNAVLKYEDNQKEGDKFMALYKDEIKILRRYNADKIDWFPRLERPWESNIYSPGLSKFLSYNQVGAAFGPRARV